MVRAHRAPGYSVCAAWCGTIRLVQLISVAIYNRDGRVRTVDFQLGRLNIVTGASRTGKSALLDIVDFCLGRDDAPIPQTRAFSSVAWYGCLWSFGDGSRAFTGRPKLKAGKSSTSRAMLRLGGPELTLPQYGDLVENTDSDTLRDRIGAQIGLEESRLSAPEGSTRGSYKVGLGQAAIFVFQTQSEIANKSMLFHRQGEDRMASSIRESLPFFLGAMSGDHAERHDQLRRAKRELRRAEIDLEAAVDEASEHDAQIRALVAEAYATGLTNVEQTPTIEAALDVLMGILDNMPTAEVVDPSIDTRQQDRLAKLRIEMRQVKGELGHLLDQRDALLTISATEDGYDAALAKQTERLRSINLLPHHSDYDSTVCPVCMQQLDTADPVPEQLVSRLSNLTSELETLALARPGVQDALASISTQVEERRALLVTIETAVRAIETTSDNVPGSPISDRAQFVRGRIDATVGRLTRRQTSDLSALNDRVRVAQQRVKLLEAELDDDSARERLTSALIRLGNEMTKLARKLKLENSEHGVRLDISKLTVVTDTPAGPVPLSGLGSGANWLGYHLVTHLALHKVFVESSRPVPHLLMLDQPTQAFYESRSKDQIELMRNSGIPAQEDHIEVTRMFHLLDEFAKSLAPEFQIIVSDHAHLTEEWFENAVAHSWRGDALVPSDWIVE